MGFVSIGDLAIGLQQRSLNAQLKNQARLQGQELASGEVADRARALDGGLDRLAGLRRRLTLLDAYARSTAELGLRASAQQDALAELQGAVTETGNAALVTASSAAATGIDATAEAALQQFRRAVAALNAQAGGQSLFAGRASDGPALLPADGILDLLEPLVAGETTAAGVEAVLDDFFGLPGGGFESGVYLGADSAGGPVRISRGQSAELPATAADPRLRAALKGLAGAALLSRRVLPGDGAERMALLRASGEALASAATGVIDLRAGIGAVEERLQAVSGRNGAERLAAEDTLTRLLAVDGYEVASRLKQTETSLESLYITTARLARLSLTRYLR